MVGIHLDGVLLESEDVNDEDAPNFGLVLGARKLKLCKEDHFLYIPVRLNRLKLAVLAETHKHVEEMLHTVHCVCSPLPRLC